MTATAASSAAVVAAPTSAEAPAAPAAPPARVTPQPLAASHIRKGVLWKHNPKRSFNPLGPWKRRWFALDEATFQMRYYNSSFRLMGTIDLRLASVVELVEHPMGRFWAFRISSSVNPRVYTLASLTRRERDSWYEHVRAITENMPPVNPRLLEQFRRADLDGSFTLEFNEVRQLFVDRGVQVSAAAMHQRFEEVDADHNNSLDFSEFERLDMSLRRDEHAFKVFSDWAGRGRFMQAPTLAAFLRSAQKERDVSDQRIAQIVARHRPEDPDAPPNSLDVWGFAEWLTSTSENGPADPDRALRVHMDMSQPLSHYWIASSHNSYLLSDNVKGAASVEAYVDVLQKGARYIEIDVWDGSGGTPVVAHASSLYQKMPFLNVLQKIKEHAFSCSGMPLVVSLDVHCSPPQQEIVAANIRDILATGGFLAPHFRTDTLPSPKSLSNKIILKMHVLTAHDIMGASSAKLGAVKTRGSVFGTKKKKGKEHATEAPAGTPPSPTSSAAPAGPLIGARKPSAISLTTDLSGESSGEDESAATTLAVRRANKRTLEETVPALAGMIHLEAVRFSGAGRSSDGRRYVGAPDTPSYHFVSMSNEKQQQVLDRGYSVAMQRYCAEHLIRVFPRGNNFFFDPTSAWSAGCQLAAINYHSTAEPVWLNDALFEDNGRCGYVLKPDWLLTGAKPPEDRGIRLSVKVISARQLPQIGREVIDPYITVQVRGHPIDFQEERTPVIDNNGWDPLWNTMMSFDLRAPEIDFLVFTVWDKDTLTRDDFVAQYAISISMLRMGVRALPLYSRKHLLLQGTRLLCEFHQEELASDM